MDHLLKGMNSHLILSKIGIFFQNFIYSQNWRTWSFLIGLIIVFTILEAKWAIRPTRGPWQSLKDEFGFVIGNNFLKYSAFGLLSPLLIHVYYVPLFPALQCEPALIQLSILLIAYDVIYYFYHRMLHRVSFLWEIHKVHHSIEDISAASGNLRYHIIEILLDYLLAFGVVLKLGFSPDVVLIYMFIQLFVNTWAHSNLAFTYGKLSHWVVTTQIHQFHHDANSPNRYGVNYGNIFTFCDKIFGSFFLPDTNCLSRTPGFA